MRRKREPVLTFVWNSDHRLKIVRQEREKYKKIEERQGKHKTVPVYPRSVGGARVAARPIDESPVREDQEASRIEDCPGSRNATADLASLGRSSGEADRELGIKEIGGKRASGFQIDMKKMDAHFAEGGTAEIWIDTVSNLPVLVRYQGMKELDHSWCQLNTDIQWNIDLDPKLFDPTPPEGYTDATPKPLALEEQVRRITEALRIYAEASGGHYPARRVDSLDTTADRCKMLGVVKLPTMEKEGNAGKARRAMAGFEQMGTIRSYNPDAAYYGKTTGPNDKDNVLLRWQLDDGRYEVIFSDLRSETVTAEQLRGLEAK